MTEMLTRELLQRFAPIDNREALGALFTIEREVMSSIDDTLDHSVAHARLGWWQDELSLLAACKARHPATRSLVAVAKNRALSGFDLRGLIEHARVELARVAFLQRAELDDHLRQWALAVVRTMLHIGGEFAQLESLALRIGTTIREIELLADFSTRARAGRIGWPLGDPPEDHAQWIAVPLGDLQSAQLKQRLAVLDAELRAACAILPAQARAAQSAVLTFAALARREARLTLQALPRARSARRSEPIRRTMRAWTAAVAVSRGRLPRALQSPALLAPS